MTTVKTNDSIPNGIHKNANSIINGSENSQMNIPMKANVKCIIFLVWMKLYIQLKLVEVILALNLALV